MKKEKLPIEENVDLEFEYKLLHFYDKVKPYLKHIIAGIIVIILIILYLFYSKSKAEKRLEEASIYIYKIQNEFEEKKYKEALKDIKFFKASYADTPFIKIISAYEFLIAKEKGNIDENKINQLKTSLSSNQLKAYLDEYKAYFYHHKNDKNNAISILSTIKQKHFNYLSAISFKGLILKSEGQNEDAKLLFQQVKELSKEKFPYFKNLAQESL